MSPVAEWQGSFDPSTPPCQTTECGEANTVGAARELRSWFHLPHPLKAALVFLDAALGIVCSLCIHPILDVNQENFALEAAITRQGW